MLVTGGAQDMNDGFPPRMMVPRPPIMGHERIEQEVACLPPIGTRLFWSVRSLASKCDIPLNQSW